ncbi:GAF domain-containing protein [Hymenobacter sp. BT635]|uniref:GAF domain-containing protein n=1 Tax=Hymenobacter nitidus TaxID=2880929 RepID=A0ABS8AAP1_9BACT|nr:GAF domain-containing protein [Hymenobacter nitidus]MCB2377471.1 GAF domain-containing protein [Hymenobacter nitidus]
MSFSRSSLIPHNDEDRLLALSRYRVAGTAPEHLFDGIAALTAKLFGAPIALVSLVAEDSVWFKAHFGLPDATRVNRAQSLCSVAILHDEATIFENLRQQPCTLIESDVLEQLNLAFYASQPLQTTDGFNIGALCVIDHQARTFTPDEQKLLKQLAISVMLFLELRREGITLPVPGAPAHLTVPALLHSLTLLAEIGSSGAAIDIDGNPVGTPAIHQEAGHIMLLINRRLQEVLAA